MGSGASALTTISRYVDCRPDCVLDILWIEPEFPEDNNSIEDYVPSDCHSPNQAQEDYFRDIEQEWRYDQARQSSSDSFDTYSNIDWIEPLIPNESDIE